ncbi:GntR family transcriptional regulator [Polaribacter sp. L3A8]|uniref:GntR family transcriptional regulator n=1 Tax=Polaribacter sp. L3A8 TaxID=2686361 RepID=UPI00131BCDE1|nr:GntR family transcriptional regulator [Polaribacter sp. L3A8]
MEVLNYMQIRENSRVPKYKQIIDSIINNISIGNIEINQKLPSINMLSEEFYLSRDTVEKAYNILKERNIIVSIPRRGNYVAKVEAKPKLNILLLVNKLSAYKMSIYHSFIKCIGDKANIDLQVYHCNELLFLNSLKNAKVNYDYFVVMPHFKTENCGHASYTDEVYKVLDEIPRKQLIVLDNLLPNINESVSTVYQEFDKDIYDALSKGIDRIKKYSKVVLVYPEKSFYPYPKRILLGFRRFCVEKGLDFDIINEVGEDMVLKKGTLFITIEESDLVNFITIARQNNLQLGTDVGIISYNDTPLKELLGITVMSTDFAEMGKNAAQIILDNKHASIKVPFNLIDRNSF